MNGRGILKGVAFAMGCGAPLAAWANGMSLLSQDGFATARGEAFVATADNPSAIYYNPAGITQIEGNSLRTGIYGIYLDPSFTPPAGAANSGHTYHIEQPWSAAPQCFFVHTPENSRWSFGAGLYAPYGAAIEWPQDTGFRAVATSGRLTYVRFNPVAGFKVTPQLSLAAGIMVDYGDLALEQGLRRNPSTILRDHFRFEGDGWAVGYNLGLLWQPVETISVGAAFRSTAPLNFHGETDYLQEPLNYQPPRLPASLNMDFPMTVAGGISYRPTEKWNLEFDATWSDWSSLGTLAIEQEGTPPIGPQDLPVKMGWKSSWLFALGVTRYLEDGWRISAGYAFNQNSVPDDYYSPIAADLDRHFLSLGAGHTGKRFDFDVAYQFGYGPERTVTGSTPSSQPAILTGVTADGNYEFISHAVLVTVGWRF